MRRGSAALIPLIIAIMLLFWYIAFMGGASDSLHNVNKITNLQRLQEKLLISSVRYRYKLQEDAQKQGINMTEAELDAAVNQYIKYIMIENKIEGGGI